MVKRVFVSLFSLSIVVLAALPLFSQDKKPKDCAGIINADGSSFTCDKDHKVWKVSNPGALQGMEGHHAKLTFRPSTADDALVLSAAAMAQQEQQTAKAADAAPQPKP
jgi:hypothetical protein